MTEQYYYTASTGLLHLIYNIQNGAAPGTGVKKLATFANNLLGEEIPPAVINNAVGLLNNLYGSYPNHSDYVPSIVFAALFAVIMFIHLGVFLMDQYRGHYFYLSLIWIFYCAMKIIGFALRAKWSTNILLVDLGLTSEIFLIVPAMIIVSANLILAQRLFTWRHPVGGSRRLFWNFMFTIYIIVGIIIAVTVLASAVPYLYFISWQSYRSWIKTVQFTAVLICLYCLTSMSLIGLSFWLPTQKDVMRYTYQPWWIESFSPLYFPKKGAAQKAAATFMKRNSNHRHATRVIAATHHHFHNVKGLTNQRGDLKHNVSMGLLILTTVLVLIESIGRAIVVFQARENKYTSPAGNRWFMYVCWGVFEIIINICYIVGRVDLRFYKPDRLPKEVRSIITANQTYYPSSDEEEDGFHRDRPETYGKIRGISEHGYKNSPSHAYKNGMEQPENAYAPYGYDKGSVFVGGNFNEEEEEEDDEDDDEFDDIKSNEWDFTVPKAEKLSSSSEEYPSDTKKNQLPYPVDDKKQNSRFDNFDHDFDNDDRDSEFNF
ncbi:hypothetical protein PVL30_003277 [Lodderomyces elongisporus]|uniref:uncharacterized protein n=1 Tax=Lodderomyces elongisporus TaxID=36914 RepID=UPI00291EB0A7|nr:uncharacterized protein PVL30_003277 [Lodderomyces elongisporus]WLF79522.1 hypothetical protein PVL30_003277 [Lodderomyces elongisporus]